MSRVFVIFFFMLLTQLCVAQDQNADGGHETWEYVLEYSGDALQIGLPLTAGILTLAKKDYEGSKKFVYSLATTMAVTYTLKHLVHKERPEGRGSYDAFPSGHTSSAFSGASFIQARYGWKYGKYAYVLAAVVGVSRMEGPDGYHDIWDVLGGAAVGIGSTHFYTKAYDKTKLQLGFSANDDVKLLTLNLNF